LNELAEKNRLPAIFPLRLFVERSAPRLALHLDPVAMLPQSIKGIATFRHYALKLNATDGLQQLEATVEAFRRGLSALLGHE
jgi:hypothetical protein